MTFWHTSYTRLEILDAKFCLMQAIISILKRLLYKFWGTVVGDHKLIVLNHIYQILSYRLSTVKLSLKQGFCLPDFFSDLLLPLLKSRKLRTI